MNAQPNESQAPSYKRLAIELSNLQGSIDSLASKFLQLEALFAAIKSGGANVEEFAALGKYVAGDFANVADCLQEEAEELAELAMSAIPAREWRTCGYPEKPNESELAAEREFARIVCDFPNASEIIDAEIDARLEGIA